MKAQPEQIKADLEAQYRNTAEPDMLEVIRSTFPEILQNAPTDLSPLHFDEELEGLCSHPELFNPNWVTAFGEQAFKSETGVPEGFFAYGYRESYSSSFFVMWQEKGRRFWLYDHFSGVNSTSPEQTGNSRNNFLTALNHWKNGGYRKPKFA